MRKTKRKSNFTKIRAKAPYLKSGKTSLSNIFGKSGVYIIRENRIITYIGFSAVNIYKTMYRHFEMWNHKGQDVVTYIDKLSSNKYTVQVTLCSPAKASKLERALIIKHKPRDNENKYKDYVLKETDRNLLSEFTAISTEEAPF